MQLRRLELLPPVRGFSLAPIHYSHDPEKDASWYDVERSKWDDAGWAKEFEIDFSSQKGKPCYPTFGVHHVVRDMRFNLAQPIDLCMDFNFTPMVWELGQVQNGWECVIDEIREDGASIERSVTELRNRLPAHQPGFRIYGDATGKNSDGHVGRSYYDLFKIAMRGYPGKLEFRLPFANPFQQDRVAAVNLKLQAPDGVPGVRISPHCTELLADLGEVVWTDNGKKILESHDPKDPYYFRGHASAAWGYKIAREWPVRKAVSTGPVPKKKLRPADSPWNRVGRAD